MPRRVSLPGASELFRSTEPVEQAPAAPPSSGAGTSALVGADDPSAPPARGSGRVRHDEKITVYVSADELLALEQARLTLRARHGLAVDRGRLVREAIAAVLAEFEAAGPDSDLVARLSRS